MSEPIHALAQLLFGKPTVDECSVEEIQHFVKRYPYFAPAQFLLLQKLKAQGSPDYEAQYRKAVLYYPDPLQFEYFISSDKFYVDESQLAAAEEIPTPTSPETVQEDSVHPGDNVVAEEQSLLQQSENITPENLEVEEEKQNIQPVFFVHHFLPALQVEENIETPEPEIKETIEETPVEEAIDSSPTFFVYDFLPASQEPQRIEATEQAGKETTEETSVDEAEAIDYSWAFFVYDFLPGIQQQEQRTAIPEQKEPIVEAIATPVDENPSEFHHQHEENRTERWEPLSEEGVASPIEIPASSQEIQPTEVLEGANEKEEPVQEEVEEKQQVAEEQVHTAIPAFVENIQSTNHQYQVAEALTEVSLQEEVEEKQESIEQEQAELPEETQQEEISTENQFEINNEPSTGGAIVVNMTSPAVDEKAGMPVFEPYHTVDYFASQGIKISAEDLSKDKLGTQLRSFTEWLKIMKRLPAAQVAKSPATIAEKSVESMASHSITESDVITEAMAEVWAKQGNREKAIETYNKLCLLNPSKMAYFAAKIENLKLS